ncbi:MAG: phosphotransferase family protein [Immundisolibacter sp.]
MNEAQALAAALSPWLAERFGPATRIADLRRLAGGASQQAWRVTVDAVGAPALIVRRDLGGRMFATALGRADEYAVIELAHQTGVPVPEPYAYLPDIEGKEAFVMACLEGETIGRRIVREPRLQAARRRLAAQMGRALAAIHGIAPEKATFLPGPAAGEGPAAYGLRLLEQELAAVDAPYPALELGLAWLREHMPAETAPVLCHGDYRVGNVVVDEQGLVGVLDWEFAHRGHPGEDLTFGAIRAWRFGQAHRRYGGVGDMADFLDAYNTARGSRFTERELYWFEVASNLKWAIATITQARRHLSGQEPSLELASLGRVTAEIELEILSLLDPRHPRYPGD